MVCGARDAVRREKSLPLHAILASKLQRFGCHVYIINGTADHVHLLHSLPRTVCMADLMRAVKAVSSRWIKTKEGNFTTFQWQDGYASFSVDYRRLDGIIAYIRDQKKHHGSDGSKMSFEKEYTSLLNHFGYGDFNPEYQFPSVPPNHPVPDPEGRLA